MDWRARRRAATSLVGILLVMAGGTESAWGKAPRKQPPKNVNSVTGTYRQGNSALGSELVVQERPGKRIRFSLYSFWRCPDGTACNGVAEGTIALQGMKAVYRQTDPAYPYVLTMRFSPRACSVDCDKPSHFGGFNVDPTGNYRKVSARAKFD